MAEIESDFRITTDTPYLALMGERWGVYCEDLGENWARYNSTVYWGTLMIYSVMYRHSMLSIWEDEPLITKKPMNSRPEFLNSLELFFNVCNMISLVKKYVLCDRKIIIESVWWLLMPWHLHGTRTSATIMMTSPGQHISGVPNIMLANTSTKPSPEPLLTHCTHCGP